MPDEIYDRGDTTTLNLVVRDTEGVLTDPGTLTLTVRSPAGAETLITSPDAPIVRDAAGTFHADIALTEAGAWVYQWQTTNPGQTQGGTLSVSGAPLDATAAYTTALSRLERLTAPDMEPLLTRDDLADLLTQARRPDRHGLLPTDADWTPSYDVEGAACAAWEVKAGRAAAGYRFSTDGQSFSRDQVHAQCLNMAALYRRGSGSAVMRSGIIEQLVARPIVIGQV